MPPGDRRPENQHYVPKLLLKNFAFRMQERGGRRFYYVHVYDKHEGRQFTPEISNIAAQRDFYEVAAENPREIENILSQLESKADSVLQKIIAARSLGILTHEEKGWLAVFVAAQFLRTAQYREMIRAMEKGMEDRIREMDINPEDIEGFSVADDEEIKLSAIMQMAHMPEYAGMIFSKNYVLFETTKENPFYLGDHPIALHNDNDFTPYGNLGFAVRGIQIYLPISPTLVIGFFCPSILQASIASLQKLRGLISQLKLQLFFGRNASNEISGQLEEADGEEKKVGNYIAKNESGEPLEIDENLVMFLNSQQVMHANRYIISATGAFDLVNSMIADNKRYRTGFRLRMD